MLRSLGSWGALHSFRSCAKHAQAWRGIAINRLLQQNQASLPPAFVFDIDGVLVRGKRVLREAQEAMRRLTSSDGRWRFPVCFLTNGGGVLESTKAQQLTSWLGVPISPEQVVLSHTPMRDLVPWLGPRPVLVSGAGDVKAAAAAYGFTRLLHTSELSAALPAATPLLRRSGGTAEAAVPTELVQQVLEEGWGSERLPVEAVLVMHDPDDWYRDLQLLLDVVLHGGAPLHPRRDDIVPGGGRQVSVYFSNPDLLWAAEFPHPRLGQGAFAAALHTLHERITGRPLPCVRCFGKPNSEPYRLIEKQLVQQAQQLGLPTATPATTTTTTSDGQEPPLPFSAIFAVGDNPAADIRGANAAGPPWVSVLVRTGVFQGSEPNSDVDPAHMVVDNVLGAVEAALHRARELRWHQQR